ncbi:MAG TPA: PQQ-binding-like beta-propeller repeat protein [Polyangiaceae bacterium]|nr:PQQ-binding-like beta-propeller repeat protein [Polyangiaceae bacterium]
MFSDRPYRAAVLAVGAQVVVACAAPAVATRRRPATSRAGSGDVLGGAARRPTTPLVTDADRAMGIEWRLDVGGTIHAAPAFGDDGAVYVGTAAGYLVALGAAGVVRFSYTLEGAIVWSPAVDAAGRIYVATTAQRLCSFQPNGALGWQVRTPVHVAGDLVLAAPSGVLFGGTDGNVWAYTPHGAAIWHAGAGQPILAGPKAFGSRAWVASADGTLLELDGAVRKRALHVDGICESIVSSGADGSVAVVASEALIGFGAQGEVRFRRDGVLSANAAGTGFVAAERGRVTRLDAAGAVLASTPFEGVASAAPVLAPSGAIYVPDAAGVLWIVPKVGVVRRVPIASAALHRPVLDVARHRVLVTAGDGIVASLRLDE